MWVKTMKYDMLFFSAAIVLLVTGCSHTVAGVKQDIQQNTPVVQADAQQAGQTIEQTGKATDTVVTAKLQTFGHDAHLALIGTEIKARIITDPKLDRSSNNIKVVSAPGEIYLKGHVTSSDLKSKTESIAQAVIKSNHAPLVLTDELTVQAT